jgi:hypothetical protein
MKEIIETVLTDPKTRDVDKSELLGNVKNSVNEPWIP